MTALHSCQCVPCVLHLLARPANVHWLALCTVTNRHSCGRWSTHTTCRRLLLLDHGHHSIKTHVATAIPSRSCIWR
jgi:hypothetical protein